ETVAPASSFEDLMLEAETVPSGSEGLVFLPYLSGERTPYPDPLACGAWIGFTLWHARGALARSGVGGAALWRRGMFVFLRSGGLGSIEQVRVSGGGAKSALWRQILADVLDAELAMVNTMEGAAYGAAILAGVGAGEWPNVERACSNLVRIVDRVSPDMNKVPLYSKVHKEYRAIYPALKGSFEGLSEM